MYCIVNINESQISKRPNPMEIKQINSKFCYSVFYRGSHNTIILSAHYYNNNKLYTVVYVIPSLRISCTNREHAVRFPYDYDILL